MQTFVSFYEGGEGETGPEGLEFGVPLGGLVLFLGCPKGVVWVFLGCPWGAPGLPNCTQGYIKGTQQCIYIYIYIHPQMKVIIR